MKGSGGSPMAKDELTGNMPTENLYSYFEELNIETHLNRNAFEKAMLMVNEVFLERT